MNRLSQLRVESLRINYDASVIFCKGNHRTCRIALYERTLGLTLMEEATSDIGVKDARLLCANVVLEGSLSQKGYKVLLAFSPRSFFCSSSKLLECFYEC